MRRGAAAEALLHDPRFQQRWDALHEQCPWATVFQTRAFVITWYETYRGQEEPLILSAESSAGELLGLLTLSVSPDEQLHVAGRHHAEYQTWLALSAEHDDFVIAALAELQRRFPRQCLRFLFLPPGTPLEWARRKEIRGRLETHSNERGLMLLGDASAIEGSLRKKSNKNRLQRLARLGSLRFEQITSLAELDAIFDEIVQYCDLRQGAVHGVLPFRQDPRKRELYRAMMQVPELLHVTVMRVGNTLAAAHVGIRDGSRVVLGLLVHSPLLAAHSPGKLHLLMLARMLSEQGFSAFDLTPGGSYKERFANGHEEVRVLTVFGRDLQRQSYGAARVCIRAGARILKACRVDPESARERGLAWLARARALTPTELPRKLIRRARRFAWSDVESRIYMIPVSTVRRLPNDGVLAKNDIGALLAYGETGSTPSRRAFLKEALGRLEEGQHVFTMVQDGLLVHYVWMAERQERAMLAVVDGELAIPPETAVVFDAVTHPSARGKGLYRVSLAQVLHEAASVPGTKYVCACVLRGIRASIHLVDEFGFIYQGSFFKRRRFGRTTRWSQMPEGWPNEILGA